MTDVSKRPTASVIVFCANIHLPYRPAADVVDSAVKLAKDWMAKLATLDGQRVGPMRDYVAAIAAGMELQHELREQDDQWHLCLTFVTTMHPDVADGFDSIAKSYGRDDNPQSWFNGRFLKPFVKYDLAPAAFRVADVSVFWSMNGTEEKAAA